MAQTIRYMDKATGVTPATSNTATGAPTAGDATTNVPADGTYPAITAVHDAQTVTVESKITLTAAVDPLATNDIYVALPLPAYHVPVDCILCADDIDTGAGLTMTVAALKQDFTDIVASTNLITASTVGQAGGVARASVVDGLRLPAVAYPRWIGIKIAAGAAGLNANAVLSLVFSYRASNGD